MRGGGAVQTGCDKQLVVAEGCQQRCSVCASRPYRLQPWETVARRIAAASLGCEKQVAHIGQTVVEGSLLQDALTRVPFCSG